MSDGTADRGKMIGLLQRIDSAGIDIVMTASLRTFDGQEGYSLAQGQ
jgi:isocitrate dehydrogenase